MVSYFQSFFDHTTIAFYLNGMPFYHQPRFPDLQYSNTTVQHAYQTMQLQHTLSYVAQHSTFYQQHWAQHGVMPSSIQSLDDLSLLPFTSKQDLQTQNDDFWCVSSERIIDYVTTSGTMGSPVILGLTHGDLDRLAYNERHSYELVGLTPNDTILLTTTMDRRFMAGLAYFLGARALGAGIVRVGAGLPALQWDTIQRVRPSVIVAVPSFLLQLIDYAKQQGIDFQNSSLKKAICIGEAIRNESLEWTPLAQRIQEQWSLDLYATYASTEMATAFTECAAQNGGHHNPALLIVEVLNEADQPVGEGELGEVVVTTLHTEAFPLVRFRTGDLCRLYRAPCSCGRTTLRLGPVVGRKGQQIKYKGTTLYPPALYNLLNGFEAVAGFVVEVSTNALGTDELRLLVHSTSAGLNLEEKIRAYCRAQLRVVPSIQFIDAETLQRLRFPAMRRKPVLLIDRRVVTP